MEKLEQSQKPVPMAEGITNDVKTSLQATAWIVSIQTFHEVEDEALAKWTGRERHPRISSTLFLNQVHGGALVVTRQRPNPANPALAPLPLDGDLVAPRPNRRAIL